MSNPAAPAAIAVDKYPVAGKPQFGGEVKIYLSRKPMYELGTLEITAVNSGVWTPNAIADAILEATPAHLVAVVENELDGGATDVEISVTGTDEADAALTGTVTFEPIAWHADQTRYWGISKGAPVEEPGDDEFKTITNVTVTTAAATAITARITIFAVPAQNTFTLVGCTEQLDFDTKSNPAKEIPCGMDGSAFSKAGRSSPARLTINSKAIDYGDGLAKYDGADVTVMAKVVKQQTLETGRVYFAGYHLKVRATNPDGDGMSMYEGEGICEDIIALTAP